jgi:DNA-binding XRE family transcriptional regulator
MASGETFKQLRKQAGLTQRQIAEALKITDQTVSNWEAGRYEPKLTIHQTQTLCQVLQCRLEDLPNFLDVANS